MRQNKALCGNGLKHQKGDKKAELSPGNESCPKNFGILGFA